MPVSFNTIPANIRVPLFYAEMDNSQAGYSSQNRRTLLIGQKLASASGATGTPMLVSSSDQAKQLFGVGSMLARMHEIYRKNDPFGEVWCMALADSGAGVAATGGIGVTGPATSAGTISLYIAGQLVQVAVANGDSAATITANIVAAINATSNLPVTASVSGGTNVSLLCRWKGSTGNDITVMDSYRRLAGGEQLPSGVGLGFTAMNSGATNPSVATAITGMGDEEYDYVIHPYSDSGSLDLFDAELNDSAGRWSYSRQVYGHQYCAIRGIQADLVTAGSNRNGPHLTLAGFEIDTPSPSWEYAAAYGARNAVFLNADVARPTQSGDLIGIIPPRAGKRFLLTERQALLNYGIATSYYSGGLMHIERAITTFQKNAFGQADTSYLDSETLHQNAYILRFLRGRITSKYARHKLANDGTRFGSGQPIVTPSIIKAELVSAYAELELLGIVENSAAFKANLIVERDQNNPNRVNILLPPDLINQLRIVALLNQFRLQS